MSYSVAIIGGGWYGCHLALTLHHLGFDVQVYEKEDRLFHHASGNNQFRLHMGFHYARHQNTRQQSRDGYFRFLERYPHLSSPIDQNIYAIPTRDSLVDFATYKLIMTSSGMTFIEMPAVPSCLADVEGALLTPERVILLSEARAFFARELNRVLVYGHAVKHVNDCGTYVSVDGARYDFVVDATWGHLTTPHIDCFYEPTLLLYYETKESFPAITFVDGPLCSIYPTEDPHVFTLSSVVHTPLGQAASAQEARAIQRALSAELVAEKRSAMEQQVSRNVPNFLESFRFLGIQLAIKTKPRGAADDRSCYVERRGRQFIVLSGKIDTIFHAAERILSEISGAGGWKDKKAEILLRDDILPTSREQM